jgi:selenocysteine lyase/cysteine desulfurase
MPGGIGDHDDQAWAPVRHRFPVLRDTTYLNCAALGPMPDFLRETYQQAVLDRQHLIPGDAAERARAGLAQYLGVDGASLSFWTNTTQAINVVAGSIDWQAGDEVVVNASDFPSNVLPWLRLRDRGVVVRGAEPEGGRVPLDAIAAQVTDKTRLVAVSHVLYQTGYRVDLDALGQFLHQRGILLSVDGIQALGLMRPPLSHVDFYMGASFKHLLGPRGLGLLYVRPEVAERLIPAMVGYASVTLDLEDAAALTDLVQGRAPLAYRDQASRFQLAHVNTEGLSALADLLSFFDSLGWDAIADRVLHLSGLALDGLRQVPGVRLVTPLGDAERLSLAVFRVDGWDAHALVDRLAARRIVCAAREGAVRAAFHVYNDASDVERLVGAVRELAGGD